MFSFKSLQYTTALSLTLVLSSIDSVSYAASSMEVKDPRIISSLLKPSSILVAKKSKKKRKKLTKAQKRERARINKAMRSTRAGVTANPTFAGKLQVIQDKESQISNTLSRLKKRLKSKRAKKKASLKNKTRRQIRFNKLLLKTTRQLRSEVQQQQAAELERQRVEVERQRLAREAERQRLAREAEARRREAERQRLERERLSRQAEERLIDRINDPAVKTAIRTLRTSNGISTEQAVNRYLNEQLQRFDNTATPISATVTLPRFVEVYEKMHNFLLRDQLGITMQEIINRDFIDFLGMGQAFDVSQTLAIYFSDPGCNENRSLSEAMAKFIRDKNPIYNRDRESKQGLEWLFYEMLQNPTLLYNDATMRIDDAILDEDRYVILNNDEKFWAAYWRSKGTPEAIKEKVLEPALRRQDGIGGLPPISLDPNIATPEDYSGKFIKAIAKTVYDITEAGNADANTVRDAINALKQRLGEERNSIRDKITDIPNDVLRLAANKRIFDSKEIKESLKEYLVVYLGDGARAQYRQKLIDFGIVNDFSQSNALANIADFISSFILNSNAGKNLNTHLFDFLKHKIQAQFAHQSTDYWNKNKFSLLPVAIINQVVNAIYNNGNGRIEANTIKDTIINVFKNQHAVEGIQIQNGWSNNNWDDIYEAMIDGIDEGPLPFRFAVDKAINGNNNINWEAVRDYIAEHMDRYKIGFNFPMGVSNQQLNRFKAVIAEIYDGVEDPILMVGDEPLRDLAEALPQDLERLFRKANNVYTPEARQRELDHQNSLNLLRQQRENTILGFNPAPNRDPGEYYRSDPNAKYGFVVQYLNNRPNVGLRVNPDQVHRDPYFYQATLPADPAPGWSHNSYGQISEIFLNLNHDAYTAMAKRMYDAVKAHYNNGRVIGSATRDNALKAVVNLFSHPDTHNETGNSAHWRQRVKRVYDAFFAGELFDSSNVPSLALQTLMSNVNCIDGARQVLNAFEQQLGVEEQLSFEQRISLPLMKLREREAYSVAAQADPGHEQNETILHFKIVGGYALSLPLNQTTMQYHGIARTRTNNKLTNVLNNFFTRYTPQAMINEIKAKFKPSNRATDDRSDNIFADEVKNILKSSLKYSNHSDQELSEDIFNLRPDLSVESIKDDAIKDLLVHLGYLNE